MLKKKNIQMLLSSILVIVVGILIANYMKGHAPQAKRSNDKPPAALSVEVLTLKKQQYTITLKTSGTVKPRTQGELIPQVAGLIVSISPNFHEGGFFSAGEILLSIDDRDYAAQVIVAESELMEAQARLSEEKARVSQAKRDWERSGKRTDLATALVLRKPQLTAAKAGVASAAARLTIAELNFERTKIKAPYAGRVLTKSSDLGQFVSVGKSLGVIYAVNYAEIRLPLNGRQLEFIDLQEYVRKKDSLSNKKIPRPKVKLAAKLGRHEYEWQGFISRTEGAIDIKSRQLYVVAQINDPYVSPRENTNDDRRVKGETDFGALQPERPPLKIGQFVRAEISGRVINDVFVIPRATLYQNNEVVLVRDSKIVRQAVDVIWKNETEVVVEGRLSEGDLLVITPLANVISGTLVGNIKEGAVNSVIDSVVGTHE